MSDREKLKVKLQDLLKQATEERSHYYVGSVIREVLAFLDTSRDSTPTEGVGKRVVEEWAKERNLSLGIIPLGEGTDLGDPEQRIDRVAAPRTDREALLWKWLHRAADTLARNQDDERVVFLLEFDRAFPDSIPDGITITHKEPQS